MPKSYKISLESMENPPKSIRKEGKNKVWDGLGGLWGALGGLWGTRRHQERE